MKTKEKGMNLMFDGTFKLESLLRSSCDKSMDDLNLAHLR